MLIVPSEVLGVEVINDFDSMGNLEQVRDQTGFDTASSSGTYLSSNVESLSSPNAIGNLSTGASNYLYVDIGHTEIGVFQSFVWSASDSGVIDLAIMSGSEIVELSLMGGESPVLAVDFTPEYTFSTLPTSEWTNILIEWRTTGSNLEFRGTVGTDSSEWIESTISSANANTQLRLRMLDTCCSFTQARLDNFFLQTDEDIPPAPEGQTWLNITYPFEGGNTASTSFDVGFTYTLDDRVEGADEFEFIRFTLCSLFYQNEPCVVETYNTSFGTGQTGTTTMNSTWEGYSLLVASYWNGVENDVTCPWWNFLCQEEQVKIGASDSIKLNIATTTISADVPDWILNGDLCSSMDSDIGNGFCQALTFLFYPSDIASESIEEIRDILAQKQPFGFFFLVSKQMDELFKTEGATGTGLTINLGADWGSYEVFNYLTAKEKVIELGLYTEDIVMLINVFLYIALITYWWFRLTGKEDTGNNTWQRGV